MENKLECENGSKTQFLLNKWKDVSWIRVRIYGGRKKWVDSRYDSKIELMS